MHEPSCKYFDIMVKAKFMCLSYVMYDVHSYESKYPKIISIDLSMVWKKGDIMLEELMTFNWMTKKCYSRLLHMM